MKNSPILKPYMEKGKILKTKYANAMFDLDRIKRLEDEHGIFRNWLGDVLLSAQKIGADEALSEFCYGVYAFISDKAIYKANKSELKFPDGAGDFCSLFPVLFFAEEMIDKCKARGLSRKIISDTLSEFGDKMTDFYDREHRPGFGYFMDWLTYFCYGDIIRIDRFNIEITEFTHPVRVYKKGDDIKILIDNALCHRGGMLYPSAKMDDEGESFLATIRTNGDKVTGYAADFDGYVSADEVTLCGYTELMCKGDMAAAVHIPAYMPLDSDYCTKSLDHASQIIKNNFSDLDIRMYFCTSWMMSNLTRKINGGESKITRFADMFVRFPTKSKGEAIYSFIFKSPVGTPIDSLPEDSSLQRNVKEFLKSGGVFYEMGGVREL